MKRPTLDEIMKWPAAVSPEMGGAALGLSRSTAYRRAADGTFPARVIKIGPRRTVIVTADLIRLLSGSATG